MRLRKEEPFTKMRGTNKDLEEDMDNEEIFRVALRAIGDFT